MKISTEIITKTFLFFFQNFEAWEKEKSENDMEFYVWELNRSKDNVSSIVQAAHPGDDNKELSPQWKINIDKYKEATVDLFNLGL